ncbi:MAG: urease accessory protein UreF [Actinobacteria bacterium]|nr:urease accessory protein UreF [Actinomycetota bacterium]
MSLSYSSLVLADGRFPAGGYAHSGGLEAAVGAGRVRDLASLHEFLLGRLCTVGLTEAALSAATAVRLEQDPPTAVAWDDLGAEAHARIASPRLRETSRRLGRQLVRTARATWPSQLLDSLDPAMKDGPHLSIAHGCVGHVAGLDAFAIAVTSTYGTVAGPATAAVRLLGLDPAAVSGLIATLATDAEEVAATAVEAGGGPLDELPCPAATLVEIESERHEQWEVRLFAS